VDELEILRIRRGQIVIFNHIEQGTCTTAARQQSSKDFKTLRSRMMRSQCRHLWQLCGVALLLAGTVAINPTHAAFINLTPTNGAANSASSVLLSDLISGEVEGIVVGDKMMSGFSYTPQSPATGDMPPANMVDVLGFQDPSGNWGLSFHGAFMDLPGGGTSDVAIRFVVNIDPVSLRQGWRITDAHLYLNGVGVGSPDSGFFVDESFAQNESNQTLHTVMSTFPNGPTKLSDWTYFTTPLTTLHVTKDILAIASVESGEPARATMIDQSFSQTQVPEPATLALSLLGTAWLIGRRRHL
jgi:hypothetical protein